MTDLDLLRSLGPEVAWPPTPDVVGRLDLAPVRRNRLPGGQRRRALLVAIAVVVAAVAVAMAVPQARSAIMRFLHIGSVTIERVEKLPPVEERPLAAGLGAAVTPAQAESVLGVPFALPRIADQPVLYEQFGVVSALLATPGPVLLSETRAAGMMKKFAGASTGVHWLQVAPGVEGIWITGAPHVVYFGLEVPPRLAGNVLLWERGGITYRLEGRTLTRQRALELAREIAG